jgi:hypothetical protein
MEPLKLKGPGWLNELASWITYQLIQAYHQYGSRFCKLQKGCTRLAAASDKVYQLLAHGRWFSPGTPASSTTKTGRHDIVEILLKVTLNYNGAVCVHQCQWFEKLSVHLQSCVHYDPKIGMILLHFKESFWNPDFIDEN